jgi:hypothetical protein
MKQLQVPKPLLDALRQDGDRVDDYVSTKRVPRSLKEQFGRAWAKPFKVGDEYIKLNTSREGTKAMSTFVEDAVLLKAACATALFDLYFDYMEQLDLMKEKGQISAGTYKKLGETTPLLDTEKETIRESINQLDLDVSSKRNLTRFLTDDKTAREEDFGNYKGLSRTDPFQPAAATALGFRIDYMGILNLIILCFRDNLELQRSFLNLLNAHNIATDSGAGLLEQFDSDLAEAGFQDYNSKYVQSY